ncbi:MAG TPA: DUF2127 domain-containing protein [Verrucomicrobiae bacterium]|nr:DUF2127 domain-containing protein [Verrucomicrobiae bacterium]
MTEKTKGSRGLWLIAAFKLVKGLGLLILAIGALKLLHKDVAAEVERWINFLRFDPHNHYIEKLLAKLGRIDERKLEELSVGTFFYAGLFLAEGIGLALRKRWAEYLTIVSTASLLPLEIYEITKLVTTVRIVLLLINIAVVAYLVIEVRRPRNIRHE